MNYKTVYPTEVLQGFTETSMFVLMLYEPISNKKVPVMIGEHEAEMIILEQEQRQARRPMTYQLILSIMRTFHLTLTEVRIERFEEGVFFASLIMSDGKESHTIDARVSDAVVLALHEMTDIVMAVPVLDEAGFVPQDGNISLGAQISAPETLEELEEELRRCEDEEDYEEE